MMSFSGIDSGAVIDVLNQSVTEKPTLDETSPETYSQVPEVDPEQLGLISSQLQAVVEEQVETQTDENPVEQLIQSAPVNAQPSAAASDIPPTKHSQRVVCRRLLIQTVLLTLFFIVLAAVMILIVDTDAAASLLDSLLHEHGHDDFDYFQSFRLYVSQLFTWS